MPPEQKQRRPQNLSRKFENYPYYVKYHIPQAYKKVNMFLSRNRIKDVVDASSEVKKESKNVVFLCQNIFQIN